MVNYRRARLLGATYFFTVALQDRRSRLLIEHADALREAIRAVKRQSPFRIDAAVVLPDHLHTLWTLPEGNEDLSGRWRAVKARFTRLLVKRRIALERNGRDEYDLWQRRFWEHVIRDESDFAPGETWVGHKVAAEELSGENSAFFERRHELELPVGEKLFKFAKAGRISARTHSINDQPALPPGISQGFLRSVCMRG